VGAEGEGRRVAADAFGREAPLAHILMGASDEAALYVAEAADRPQARAEMIAVLDRIINAVLT
jgi:hypothetical protein